MTHLGDSRDHTDDDSRKVLWSLSFLPQNQQLATGPGAERTKNAYGPTMLPTATPTKMIALLSIFLVFPPLLAVTSERASENTALEAPVKSDTVVSCLPSVRAAKKPLTIPNKLGGLVLPICHHCESEHGETSDDRHDIGTNIVLECLVVRKDRNDTMGHQRGRGL